MIDRRVFTLPGMRQAAMMITLLSILQAIAIIFQARYLAEAIVSLWQLHHLTTIIRPTILFAVFFLVRHLITLVEKRILYPKVESSITELRTNLMDKLFVLGPSAVAEQGTGNVVTMALEGIDKVETYLMMIIIKVIDMSITPWLILIYIATLQIKSALFLFAIFPLIILFMVILGLAAQSRADKQYAGYQRLSNHFVDTLRGLPTLKQLGLDRKYADNVYNVSEDYRKETMATLRIGMTSTFALDFFTTLSIAIVAVILGFGLMDSTIALFPALTILILAPDYFLPIRNFSSDYHATLDGKNAMTAVMDILAMPTPTDTTVLPATSDRWTDEDQLSVQHMDVQYDAGVNALSDINFEAHGYQKIGVIGASGSGKSTLINTLGGFQQPVADQGTLTIQGTQVPHFSQQAWQQQFHYIPQNPYLFHASLRENIAFYAPEATDAEVIEAVDRAGLTNWVATLAKGLETQIGEGARGVSGGQAQRIALARVLLDPRRRVLLFDEPTAHLDLETEISLKQAILPVLENHLVFFATHRLHWMDEMDYLLVLDHGKIVEQGTPEELMAKNGFYTTLRSQMAGETL